MLLRKQAPAFKPYFYLDLKVHYMPMTIGKQSLQGKEGNLKGRVARKQSSDRGNGQYPCPSKEP